MDRNGLLALAVLAALALFLSIDWLFLTALFLIIIVFYLGRRMPIGTSLSGSLLSPPRQAPPQQPVVIQSSTAALGHQFYTDMVSSIVQSALNEDQFKGVKDDVGGKISGLQEHVDNKLAHLEKKIGKGGGSGGKGGSGNGGGHGH